MSYKPQNDGCQGHMTALFPRTEPSKWPPQQSAAVAHSRSAESAASVHKAAGRGESWRRPAKAEGRPHAVARRRNHRFHLIGCPCCKAVRESFQLHWHIHGAACHVTGRPACCRISALQIYPPMPRSTWCDLSDGSYRREQRERKKDLRTASGLTPENSPVHPKLSRHNQPAGTGTYQPFPLQLKSVAI